MTHKITKKALKELTNDIVGFIDECGMEDQDEIMFRHIYDLLVDFHFPKATE